MSDSLMEQGVVGRDKARRGQPVAKPVAQSVTQPMPVRDREKDREMLARMKEFDGDMDCVGESRRVRRRGSLRESFRAWLRVQVCLRESLQGSFRVWVRV